MSKRVPLVIKPGPLTGRMPASVSMERIREAEDENEGFCAVCQDWTHETCEPDARGYKCPDCGERACYGVFEVMMEVMP